MNPAHQGYLPDRSLLSAGEKVRRNLVKAYKVFLRELTQRVDYQFFGKLYCQLGAIISTNINGIVDFDLLGVEVGPVPLRVIRGMGGVALLYF